MKRSAFILLAVLASATLAHSQQKADELDPNAIKVLRQAVQDFEKNPKAAEEARRKIETDAKAAAEAARIARSTAPTATGPGGFGAGAASQPQRSFAEMEKLYLEGKINAKDFQKYLQGQRIRPPTAAGSVESGASKGPAMPTPTNAVATPEGRTAPAAMTDVEKKLDELIRAQDAREKAATNVPSAVTGPKTKRQKLDDLLKRLIENKVSEEDYKAERQKILAEPD